MRASLCIAVLACLGHEIAATTAKMLSPHTMQEARLCLSRVSSLPKAEGYGALCTSIQALYQEQQSSAKSVGLLQKEVGEAKVLEKRNEELEKEVTQLKQHQKRREEEWQAAAKKFQGGVTHRDAQWEAKIRKLEEEKKNPKQGAALGKRGILLAQRKSQIEEKEHATLYAQIKALQAENARLVAQCA